MTIRGKQAHVPGDCLCRMMWGSIRFVSIRNTELKTSVDTNGGEGEWWYARDGIDIGIASVKFEY